MRAEVYSRELKLRDGKKVPAIVADDMALLNRALKGDHRAAQIVYKTAKELGVLTVKRRRA